MGALPHVDLTRHGGRVSFPLVLPERKAPGRFLEDSSLAPPPPAHREADPLRDPEEPGPELRAAEGRDVLDRREPDLLAHVVQDVLLVVFRVEKLLDTAPDSVNRETD